MNRRSPWGLGACRWGIVGVCTLLVFAYPAEAQIGLGGGGRHGGQGGPRIGDPTDPAKQAEAIRRKAQKYFDAGNKLLEKGRVQPAKSKFKAVIELVGTEGVGQAAFSQLLSLHSEGMAHLEQAADLFEKAQYREALKLAKETKVLYANLFGGVPGTGHLPNVAQEAALLMKQIEADPKAREAIQEYAAARKFKRVKILEKQAGKDRAKYYDVFKLLGKIAKRYPDCPTGRECAQRLGLLKGDEKLHKFIKEEQRRRLITTSLRRAEQYERNGLHEDAKAEYEKLARRFPGRSLDELRKMAEKR
ncbi:MAG: hypothetical protein JXQ75_07880 [Phycisphaerae bacterium]|nr:hypothetical protein [Phycisphaerae bacterium]